MINYPISFFAESDAPQGMKTSWDVKSSDYEAVCSVPKEFEGDGGSFSPEDFFLLSLQNCFVATFKVYAEYSKLSFENLKVHGELIVDKDENQKPMMKTLHLKIELHNVSDVKKATLLTKKTIENGFILQSVKTEIKHELIIT